MDSSGDQIWHESGTVPSVSYVFAHLTGALAEGIADINDISVARFAIRFLLGGYVRECYYIKFQNEIIFTSENIMSA